MLNHIDLAMARLFSLHIEGINAVEIAATLNFEGFTTIKNQSFTPLQVNTILYRFKNKIQSRYTIALKRAGATNGN